MLNKSSTSHLMRKSMVTSPIGTGTSAYRSPTGQEINPTHTLIIDGNRDLEVYSPKEARKIRLKKDSYNNKSNLARTLKFSSQAFGDLF